jgi:hypothetical protein
LSGVERRTSTQSAGGAGLEGLRELLQELVVDADVRKRARERARRGADRETEERVHEQHADECSPEAAAERAGCRQVHELAELHGAVLLAHGDDGVAQVDEVLALELQQREPDFFGLDLALVSDDDQRSHASSYGLVEKDDT